MRAGVGRHGDAADETSRCESLDGRGWLDNYPCRLSPHAGFSASIVQLLDRRF